MLPSLLSRPLVSCALKQLAACSPQATACCQFVSSTSDATISIQRPTAADRARETAEHAREKAKALLQDKVVQGKAFVKETRDQLREHRKHKMQQTTTADASQVQGAAATPQGTAATPQGTALPPLAHHIQGTTCNTRGARFQNPWPTAWEERSFMDVLAWQRSRSKLGVSLDGWLEGIPHPKPADFARAFPLQPVDWAAVSQPPEDAIQAVWVGHATVLVQMAGLTFITDPCLSQRCSPSQWFGPKRAVAPALEAEDPRLNNLDFVLLSHNHYDHLDHDSVMRLYKRFGDKLTWYVPLGVKAWFDKCGITNVKELDWWQDVQHGETKTHITFVPAMHWSARGVFDRRNTLWGGYVVKSAHPDLTYYFAGDTGYCDVFQEIGARLGPMDLSSIPIGAYEPRWFMRPQHVNPEEGFKMHQDVRSKRSMAIHCCTWSLTDEPLDEPPRRLAEAISSAGGDPQEFVTLAHGSMIQVKDGVTLNTPVLLTPATAAAAPAVEPIN